MDTPSQFDRIITQLLTDSAVFVYFLVRMSTNDVINITRRDSPSLQFGEISTPSSFLIKWFVCFWWLSLHRSFPQQRCRNIPLSLMNFKGLKLNVFQRKGQMKPVFFLTKNEINEIQIVVQSLESHWGWAPSRLRLKGGNPGLQTDWPDLISKIRI